MVREDRADAPAASSDPDLCAPGSGLAPAPAARASGDGRFGELVGRAPAMRAVYHQIARVAAADSTVLITGESGSGKELAARTIHALGARRAGPFVPVNCASIVPELIEAELFGHEKGSFTGACDRRRGTFEHASGGTLLLDEITEMPLAMQVRLLRVLETGRFFRVGGHEEVTVDVRVIAAANRSLDEAVAQRRLREDLLYRLAVFPIRMPSLRERREDIALLARQFVAEQNRRERGDKTLSRDALALLRKQPWHGNVRELRNTLTRAYILSDRVIEPAALQAPPRANRPAAVGGALSLDVGMPLAQAQRRLILATLARFGGDKRRAARTLGISLKTLYNRLGQYVRDGAVMSDPA